MNGFDERVFGRWSRAENSENARPSADGADDRRDLFPRNRYPEEFFGSQTRISDVRENWRLRIAMENQEKESRSREKPGKSKRKEEEPPPKNLDSDDYRFSDAPTAVETEWKYSESISISENEQAQFENPEKKGFQEEPDQEEERDGMYRVFPGR